MKQKIRIHRIDKTIPLPEYKTKGAVAFDLSARLTVVIQPNTIGYVPLNLVIEPPEDHYVALVARSSLHKRGLMAANGFGVFDRDYCGNTDEYVAVLLNFTGDPVTVAAGDRIMQAVVSPFVRVDFEEVEDMNNASRGGFGTTGER